MRILAIIPARGGSKRLPGKNIKALNGKPLIQWTIESALHIDDISRVMVSTDCKKTAKLALSVGAEVPYIRPAELATDTSTSSDVIKHALDYYAEQNEYFDFILFLQPTSPIRSAKHNLEVIKLLQAKNADAIVSVCECEHSPLWTNTLPSDFLSSNIYAYVMDNQSSVDIDTKLDFIVAETIMREKQMNKILIIGAGQLGSRHLQGALQSALPLNITVVDPSSDSLNIAQQRAEQVSIENAKSTVQYSQSLPKAESFDVCIIATSAPVRAKVTASLLAENKVRYIIFEKVLFQALHEYTEVAVLLEQHNVIAWVNCPRRLYRSYQKIKELLNQNEVLSMKVSGSGWGMACNSIHFIDLFSYLCNEANLQATENNLDTQLLESKRSGFYELTGKAKFMLGKHSLELECTTADEVAIKVSLTSDSNTIKIDEIAGTINAANVSAEQQFKHQVKYQSELTGLNIDEILNINTSSLTPFNESCQLHTPMIELYLEHINNVLNKSLLACPIT